ncbi:hypothetical protein GQX73_g7222 [Xylaria multiplex]|uniref:Uncharacterized protein n=1 Tax=Xylaria multiplex TaxID=323545 RepID=A0A7C8MPM5_9PEZI|nr:hypothetical protein GQX73_g7222 [Xylaria multiplex]
MKKLETENKLLEKQKPAQEPENSKDFLQRLRENAPPPEPILNKMDGIKDAQIRGTNWEKYASSKNMSQFGNLTSSNMSRPFVETRNGRQKEKRGTGSLPLVNTTKRPRSPPKQNNTGRPKSVLAKCQPKPRTRFGEPSPPRHSPKKPPRVHDNIGLAEVMPRTERSLEDLYDEHPEKRLQGHIEPSTMNLAAKVVSQIINEAGYQWLNKWCPHMNLGEIFEAIHVGDKETELSNKKFNVPPEAIDTSIVKTSLAGLYRRCCSGGPGDVEFPELMKLIDDGVVFLRALRDSKFKALLQETRSTFQWIPIGLDAKKGPIIRRAKAELEKLNRKYTAGASNGKVDSEALTGTRRAEELTILDRALVDFDTRRKTFENEMLERLCVLLASTNSSAPKPNLPTGN